MNGVANELFSSFFKVYVSKIATTTSSIRWYSPTSNGKEKWIFLKKSIFFLIISTTFEFSFRNNIKLCTKIDISALAQSRLDWNFARLKL